MSFSLRYLVFIEARMTHIFTLKREKIRNYVFGKSPMIYLTEYLDF